jgi:hypothetical protein
VNAGQIESVDGHIRAPGVFSYISGAAEFYSLVAAFLLSRYTTQEKRNNLSLILAALGLALAISVSVSRTLILSVGLVVVSFFILAVRAGLPRRKLLSFGLMVLCIGGLGMFSTVVREGNRDLLTRWTMAEASEGSFLGRAFGDFWVSGSILNEAGLAGKGIGVGTNMGAALLGQEGVFLLAEKEWERVVLEMGIVLGAAFILWRIALFFKILQSSLAAWTRRDLLPSLLLAASGYTLVSGQSGQPATLGFIALAGGLTLAAGEARLRFRVHRGMLIMAQQAARFNRRGPFRR